MIKLLIDVYPDSVKMKDGHLRLPIHYAVSNIAEGQPQRDKNTAAVTAVVVPTEIDDIMLKCTRNSSHDMAIVSTLLFVGSHVSCSRAECAKTIVDADSSER